MNHLTTSLRRTLRLWAACLLWLAGLGQAMAQNNILKVTQKADATEASIRNYQVITFRIAYAVTSTTQKAMKSTILFGLDNNFELVGMQKSTKVKNTSFNNSLRIGTFTFEDELEAGSTGEVAVQVRFLQTTPVNTVASMQPSFFSNNSLPSIASKLTVKAIDPPVSNPGQTYVRGISMEKYGADYIPRSSPWVEYWIRHGNTGGPGDGAGSYVVEDVFPAGTRLRYFNTDRWWGTNNAVTVRYRTNTNSTWRQWGPSPLYRTGDNSTANNPGGLGLGSTEYVTALRFEYGTLAGGSGFHPDNMANYLFICLDFIGTPSATATILTNCASASATGYLVAKGCKDGTFTPSAPRYYSWTDWDGSRPIEMGENITINGHLGQYPDSAVSMVNPVIIAILPPEFEYVGNFVPGGVWDSSPRNAPLFDKVDNYRGTGQTLLRWRWNATRPFTIPSIRDWQDFFYRFDVRIRPGTPNANYDYYIYSAWQQPNYFEGNEWMVLDTYDIDQDGSTKDYLLTTRQDIPVLTNGGLADVTATMEVKGELDGSWSKFPATGLTVPSGRADYQLTIENEGGVIMKDPVVIDILPAIGDRGVIDTSLRGSEWEPFLAGEVASPAGMTVYYSLSRNPCRNELTPGLPAGCEDPKWSVTPPSDITRVKSLKFDGTGRTLRPCERLEISWPMRAPLTAPTGGELAWNSFGMVLKRADDNTSTLPTEPVKTGIAIKPPDPPYYGDRVWIDSNRNGLQDKEEKGLNGVRVDLYRDNGDKKADPITDKLVSFTVTSTGPEGEGFYRFGNIGKGSYFAVLTPGDDFGITSPDRGADDQLDSDGQPTLHRGRRAAILPVTELVDLEEDMSWDLGVFDRSGIPAVWAVAPQADGRLVIGGKFISTHGLDRRNIARILENGKPDATFAPGTGFDGSVRSLAIRSDGLIWAGGSFTTFNGQEAMGVALLKADGSFAGTTAQPDTSNVNWVGIRGTTMFLAGSFGKVGGIACGNIAALNTDGSVNGAFKSLPGANNNINSAAILGDGGLILVGAFTSYGDAARNRMVKLTSDGSVDPAFDPGVGANGEIFSIKVIEDGRMIITGSFTDYGGVACNGTMRVLTNGKPDPSIAPSTLAVKSINSSN
jgi:hypothetical protein